MSVCHWLRHVTCFVLVCAILSTGCDRHRRLHYRVQADQEAQYLVEEKSDDARWGLPYFSIEQDARSRYFDPYPIDATPMPPDDPASHVFMHRVNGMKGWPKWHKWGDRRRLANPDWCQLLGQYVDMTPSGAIILDLDSSLRLAYMHSPAHQRQLETVYLTALDVSTERFRLQTQFFGGNDTTFNHRGEFQRPRFINVLIPNSNPPPPFLPNPNPPPTLLRRLVPADASSLATTTGLSLERRFATAGTLLIDFANTFAWTFGGPDTNSAVSLLSMNLFQPLLRGAGRDIALEQLTIVERGLLANLRAYQRYRQGFFTNVAIGEAGVTGPQRRGGFTGGTGLTGFTGTGSGGFGGVGAATGFGRGGFGGGGGGTGGGTGFAGGGAGQVGGFIGLLQSLQEIRNTEVSLASQVRTLSLLEASLEAGVIDLTQVDQFRQNIETERANLLQNRNGLTNSIESYLTGTLGLPPNLQVQLDDELVRQFQLLDSRTTNVQSSFEHLQDAIGELADNPTYEIAQDFFAEAEERMLEVGAVVQNIDADIQTLLDRAPRRLESMTTPEQRLFHKDIQSLQASLEGLKVRLNQASPRFEEIRQQTQRDNVRQSMDQVVTWLRDYISLVQELSLVQARARVESIVLNPLEIDAQTAFRFARAYRLDLMNNRAALVDSWRLIQFNADRLQSDLNIFINADLGTMGNNALDFRRQTGRVTAGVQFDAPFTRLLERNNYRQQLINYQQDRRQLIQFYDGVHQTMRRLIRDMEQLRINLEIQRRAVVIAIRRVDLTREDLNEPTAPPEPGQPASQLGPTAATNLLTALSDLRNTQNNFMSVWLNYYADEMRLARETGLMQLDENGAWIDVPLIQTESLPDEELELPPPVPTEWMNDAPEPPEPPEARRPRPNKSQVITVSG